jgi:hypothetical protein
LLIGLIERIEAHRFYGDGPSDANTLTTDGGVSSTYQPAPLDDDSLMVTADSTMIAAHMNSNASTVVRAPLPAEQKRASSGSITSLSGASTQPYLRHRHHLNDGRSLNGDHGTATTSTIVSSHQPPPDISPTPSLDFHQPTAFTTSGIAHNSSMASSSSAPASVVSPVLAAAGGGGGGAGGSTNVSPQLGPFTPSTRSHLPGAASIAIPSKAQRPNQIRGLPPPMLGSPLDLGMGSLGSPDGASSHHTGSSGGHNGSGSNTASPLRRDSNGPPIVGSRPTALSASSPIFPAPPALMGSPAYGPAGTPGAIVYNGDGSFGAGNEHGQWAPEDEDLTLDNYLAADFDNEVPPPFQPISSPFFAHSIL